MSKWLASIQSLEEAQLLLADLPDILDMKNPSKGALGALTVDIVAQVVTLVEGRCQTSATIGDLPMQADLISSAMIEMAGTGVDYIKIGLFPDDSLLGCITDLADTISKLKVPVIAVVFADKTPKEDIIPQLKTSGFNGVMVDTAIKNGLHLLDHWDRLKLIDFVKKVQQQEMLCGLAGALRYEDIQLLQPLTADYLGFRSALCHQRQRTATIDLALVKRIQQAIHQQAEAVTTASA
ncbi:MAG: hypothetical protein COB23_00815 [Methylophaga sp.]|nr:MAG: hypothetical protein COB23_00815 [Methylophaga sp.]